MQISIAHQSVGIARKLLLASLVPLGYSQAAGLNNFDTNAVQADQTVFQMQGCDGCSVAQMKAKALTQAVGSYVFVYNLAASRIFKYRIYLDTTCRMNPLVKDADGNSAESNPVRMCGAYRDAIESPVDPAVMSIFGSMRLLYVNSPMLLSSGKAGTWWNSGNGIRRLPNDPSTGQPFDLPNVAWEYPQGTGYRFMEQVKNIMQNLSQLNDVDPDLYELIYGIWIPSVNVSITISTNPSISVQGTLQMDTDQPVQMKICNTAGDCADVEVSRNRNQITVNLKQVVTRDGNMYPMPSRESPAPAQWAFPNGGGDSFANSLRGHGVDLPQTSSGYRYISCSWAGKVLIGCIIYNN